MRLKIRNPLWRALALVGGLMGLGFGVRLHGLTARDLWYDEQVTLVDSQGVRPPDAALALGPFMSTSLRGVDAGLLSVARLSAAHDQPLYVSLIHLWTRLAGVSEYSLRLPSALLGAASVGLLTVVGRGLIGETGGLLAALLLAVSPLHVHYSQEARSYSAAVFLTLLCMVLLLRLREGNVLAWIGYGTVAALAPMIHLLAGVALLPHAAVLWPLRHRRLHLALAVLAALLTLCLLLPLGWVDSVRIAHLQSGIAFANPAESLRSWARPASLPNVLAGLLSSTTRLLGLEYFPLGWRARQMLPLSLPFLCLCLYAGWSRPQPQRTLLLSGALLPLCSAAGLSVWYGHVVPLQDRYSAWAIPFWALLLVQGPMGFRSRSLTRLVISIIVLVSAGFLVGGQVVGWSREGVRSNEVRSFLSCAPATEVLQVSKAWHAEVVTAFAPQDVNLMLRTAIRSDLDRPTFVASDTGICRRPGAILCESAIPPCSAWVWGR